MNRPLRIGMAGIAAAWWPVAIAMALQEKKGARLLAAATLDASDSAVRDHLKMLPDEFACRFGLKLYRDPVQMVRRERLDAVAICTPNTRHALWAERLAALGVDLYLCKPMATTLADARRIVQAGKRHGVAIAVGPSDRFVPAIAAARQAVADGTIGSPFSLGVSHNHGRIDSFHPRDWYRHAGEGGPELSLGWYVLDLVLYFLPGRRVQSVFASYANHTSKGSPFMDCGKMLLQMEGGLMASCDLHFCHQVTYPSWQMEIVGPKGVIKVQADGRQAGRLVATVFSGSGIRDLKPPANLPDREVVWVEDFRHHRPSVVAAEQALLITRLSLAARASARHGRVVRV